MTTCASGIEDCPACPNMWGATTERNYTEKEHPHPLRREHYARNESRRRIVDGAEQNIAGIKGSVELEIAQFERLLATLLEQPERTEEVVQSLREVFRVYAEGQAGLLVSAMEHSIDHSCVPIDNILEQRKLEGEGF